MISQMCQLAQLRLDRATRELGRTRIARDRAESEWRQAESYFQDYQQWSVGEKHRLFLQLTQKLRNVKSLEDYEQRCNGFKLHLEDLKQQLQRRKKALDTAEEQFQQSLKKLQRAERRKEKYRHLDKEIRKAGRLAQQRREEVASEEIASGACAITAGLFTKLLES